MCYNVLQYHNIMCYNLMCYNITKVILDLMKCVIFNGHFPLSLLDIYSNYYYKKQR